MADLKDILDIARFDASVRTILQLKDNGTIATDEQMLCEMVRTLHREKTYFLGEVVRLRSFIAPRVLKMVDTTTEDIEVVPNKVSICQHSENVVYIRRKSDNAVLIKDGNSVKFDDCKDHLIVSGVRLSQKEALTFLTVEDAEAYCKKAGFNCSGIYGR